MSAFSTQRENAVKDWLLEADWAVTRSPASLGEWDLMAMRRNPMRIQADHWSSRILVEVKATANGPYHGFLPKDRSDILWWAAVAGADAWLAWWPKRGQLLWIHSSEWPKGSVAPETHSRGVAVDASGRPRLQVVKQA